MTWGRLVEETLPHSLLPHILVTTPKATVGGSPSANCISRSQARYGHLGDQVISFQLLTPKGELLDCSREIEADLFRAAIGGFGWFGFVTRITLRLMEIGSRRRVPTEIERREGLTDFLTELTAASSDPGSCDATYPVFSLKDPQRGAVFRSLFTDEPAGRKLFLHEPGAWYRPLAELLFTSSRIGNALCHASYKHVFGTGPFIDELRGYSFPIAGHEPTKKMTARTGFRMRTVQPSYLLPAAGLRTFLDCTTRLFHEHGVYPSLLDALYCPADHFLLSSGSGLSGMLVIFTFESLTLARCEQIRPCLFEVGDACLNAGGRLHLVKSLYASREQLGTMYAHAVSDLARLKARADPSSALINDFFTRAFG